MSESATTNAASGDRNDARARCARRSLSANVRRPKLTDTSSDAASGSRTRPGTRFIAGRHGAGAPRRLSADCCRLEPGAKPQRVVDDDCATPALDEALALHGVDLARHGFPPRIDARSKLRLVRRRDDDGALRILPIGTSKAQKLGVDAAANV